MEIEPLFRCTDYTEGQIEAVHRVLLELSNLFQQYKDEICVVGGWVPCMCMKLK